MTGLFIQTADEKVLVDMTSKISQMVGSVDTGGAAGSIAIPAPPAGKVMFYIVVPLVDLAREKGKKPGVTITGNTLSWSYSYSTSGWGYFSANCRIYYGYH